MAELPAGDYQELNLWKERFELAILGSKDGLWDWDMNTGEVYMSPQFKSMIGYSDDEIPSCFGTWENNVHPDDIDAAKQAIDDYLNRRIPRYEVEFRMRHKDGHFVHILSRGNVHRDAQDNPVRFVGTHSDVSERKQAEKKWMEKSKELEETNTKLQEAQNMLLQQEKMASIGQLAAGVAHEINNPVGFIQSNIRSLKKYLDEVFDVLSLYEQAEPKISDPALVEGIKFRKDEMDFEYLKDDVFELVDECQDGLGRIVKIVYDLKDFSYMGEFKWEKANITKGIETTLNIAHNELKYKADIVKEFSPIPEIDCIPSQLNQVFLNLLVNAAHAIEGRGKVFIRTGKVSEDKVFVEIEDTGKGIPQDKINKIFDPFFTTKPIGKGTGLGLSLAYGIIEKHQGTIVVNSQENVGTVFRIELPVVIEKVDAEPLN